VAKNTLVQKKAMSVEPPMAFSKKSRGLVGCPRLVFFIVYPLIKRKYSRWQARLYQPATTSYYFVCSIFCASCYSLSLNY